MRKSVSAGWVEKLVESWLRFQNNYRHSVVLTYSTILLLPTTKQQKYHFPFFFALGIFSASFDLAVNKGFAI